MTRPPRGPSQTSRQPPPVSRQGGCPCHPYGPGVPGVPGCSTSIRVLTAPCLGITAGSAGMEKSLALASKMLPKVKEYSQKGWHFQLPVTSEPPACLPPPCPFVRSASVAGFLFGPAPLLFLCSPVFPLCCLRSSPWLLC